MFGKYQRMASDLEAGHFWTRVRLDLIFRLGIKARSFVIVSTIFVNFGRTDEKKIRPFLGQESKLCLGPNLKFKSIKDSNLDIH